MADFIRKYCINGDPTNIGYSWRIIGTEEDEYGAVLDDIQLHAPAVASGGPEALAAAFVDSIIQTSTSVTAAINNENSRCFSIAYSEGTEFNLFVGAAGSAADSQVTIVPVSYNPQIYLVEDKPILFAPHINSPIGGETFNRGIVSITWDNSDPPSQDESVSTDDVTHEIEYTDNYQEENTTWYTLKRRIAWSQTSFQWDVGKMIKSKKVRIRMRSKTTIEEVASSYSVSGGDFSINVFDLIAPAIVNPLPNSLYTDFILIILDETLTVDTYHQKVRYTFQYASKKRDIEFTTIITDVPVGQNIVRWNIEDLPPSDDYILKLTVKNNSCLEGVEKTPDQIAVTLVDNIFIQQAGTFIIDTKPPQAVLELEGNRKVTNQLDQILNIFAEDATTEISQIQLRECDATTQLIIGNPPEPEEGCDEEPCKDLVALIQENTENNFDRLLGKPLGFSSKMKWTFQDCSGLRKIESLLTDSGGNTSLQETTKVFISAFNSEITINDFIIVTENREITKIVDEGDCAINVDTVIEIQEVVYLGIDNGEFWVLEPFGKLLYTLTGLQINKLFRFLETIYLFTYSPTKDEGGIYRHDSIEATLLNTFTTPSSIITGVGEFNNKMYFGMSNGELWSYDGVSFSLINTFLNSIAHVFGDKSYVYIGFKYSTNIVLYNGSTLFTIDTKC